MRIEALRFSLLIVLTVALASVAFRIDSHSSARSAHAPHGGPTGAPQSSAQPSSGQPSSSQPSSSPSGHPRPSTAGGGAVGGSGGTGSGGTGSGSDTGGAGTGSQQVLPVTGWDSTMKLGALAFVLIGGGVFSIRSARPSRPRPIRQRQRASVQD